MPKVADRIYTMLPVWAQNAAITAYGGYWRSQRLGGRFQDFVREFRSRDRLTPAQMDEYVSSKLRLLLVKAFETVPHYQAVWASAGLSCTEFERGDLNGVLKALPITSKDDVRRDPWEFVIRSKVGQRGLREYLTSGSTGTPVTAIWQANDHRRFIAAREARSFNWANTSLLKSRSMIGGRMVVPRPDSRPPFHRYNAIEKQVYLSAFHISPVTVGDYVKALEKHRPAVMTGYAHSHFTLARLMLEADLALSYRPDALVLGSEKTTPHMREIMESAFNAPVFEEYGCVENCVLATECEEGRLHVSPDFGIVEILDEDGQPVPAGVDGRIVCTGLLNQTQFLIRYEVGDIGRWGTDPCPCGRSHLPVIEEIVGRLEDVVIGPDGREVVRFHGIFVGLAGVEEGQVVQLARDRIRVKIVANSNFGEAEETAITGRIIERLGPISVEVTRVPRIERDARGKFRAVISRVPASGCES
jgi:phenylacetate-CoA ligase